MIKTKIGPHPVNFPTAWEDLTFAQYLAMLELKNDHAQLLSILTGLDGDYLRKAIIPGLDELLTAASFVNKPPVFQTSYPKIGPFPAPVNKQGKFDIRFESLGQFLDLKAVMDKNTEGDETTRLKFHLHKYAKYIAIYLQKIRDKEYDSLKVPELEEEVMKYPCGEVLALGGFFFLKLRTSLHGTAKTSHPTAQNPKKSKPVSKNSKRSSATTPRSRKYRRR